MPHQCTQCGHTFPDGSKEMLSGCPDCGGNKFQFRPASDARETSESKPDSSPPTESASNDDSATSEDLPEPHQNLDESTAVEPESELEAETETADDSEPETESDDSDMMALRRELDDQFESIKILEPGQYELNLMELYNREEYIIALQEDGQYVIEVPESWLGGDDF